MGFDGLFVGRVDYRDKSKRLSDATMEMLWRAEHDRNPKGDLFTSVLYPLWNYFSPGDFCWDVLCNSEPMVDNPSEPRYNARRRAAEFIDYVREQAAGYAANHVLVPMGGDFHYTGAHVWYKNMDKLIKAVNDLQVIYPRLLAPK
jgi:lysosomal alpha-mannosidase